MWGSNMQQWPRCVPLGISWDGPAEVRENCSFAACHSGQASTGKGKPLLNPTLLGTGQDGSYSAGEGNLGQGPLLLCLVGQAGMGWVMPALVSRKESWPTSAAAKGPGGVDWVMLH